MDTTIARSASHEPSADRPAFPVVGIGASAGGLEAFTQMFEHLPATTGMAYVVIQHLDPSHPSLLPGLLARATRMPVCEGQDGLTIEPDHVYVIPSNVDMTLEQGTLTLRPRTQRNGQHFAIDTFFLSLAHDRQQQAIGVLLSGTASDGTLGLQAIKAAGGITFAQDAHTAAFPQMPQSAIATGCVDRVLPPEEIAQELVRLSAHPYVAQPKELTELPPGEEQSLTALLRLLRTVKGVDFLAYKPATLKRRILHRMAVQHLDRLADYVTYLDTHQDEVEALYQNVLIHVTSFFRDPDAFDALRHLAFPAIVERHALGDPIRMWVSGCSSGEEAYSLLICLQRVPGRTFAFHSCPALRDRHQSNGTRASQGRHLSGSRDARGLTQAAAAVLYAGRSGERELSHRHSAPRAVHLRPAQRGERPPVLAPRPGELPQPAHLPEAGPPTESNPDLPLCAESAGVSLAWHLRKRWPPVTALYHRRAPPETLSQKNHREKLPVQPGHERGDTAGEPCRRRRHTDA